MQSDSFRTWSSVFIKIMNWSELRGILLVVLGTGTLLYYYGWWFVDGRIRVPWLGVAFLISLVFTVVQVFGSWVLYLATHHRDQKCCSSNEPFTVDVFVTTCGEDHTIVERSLTAACRMRGSHRTWLLDDGGDPVLEELAGELGAGYLTRNGRLHAKAGNINSALARTDGNIVVIFDVDHVPQADFLERTLPLFSDPNVGFVQVMLTFENRTEGWIAQAAGETTLDFYNPTSLGADGLGSATLIGSNALIRRSALESIDGYHNGLAEDLATSVTLHAAGWRSIYVHEPLAPGMAPADLFSWFTQQVKWARGVFELLLTTYPRLFLRLPTTQRIAYAVRMTYYWTGLAIAIHILLTVIVLWQGNPLTLRTYADYLQHLLPLALMMAVIRQLALRRWRHPTITDSADILQLRAMLLVSVTWPAYVLAWLLAILRVPLSFRPTPKLSGNLLHPLWIVPHIGALLLLAFGSWKTLSLVEGSLEGLVYYSLPLAFAIGLLVSQLFLPFWWLIEAIRKMQSARTTAAR